MATIIGYNKARNFLAGQGFVIRSKTEFMTKEPPPTRKENPYLFDDQALIAWAMHTFPRTDGSAPLAPPNVTQTHTPQGHRPRPGQKAPKADAADAEPKPASILELVRTLNNVAMKHEINKSLPIISDNQKDLFTSCIDVLTRIRDNKGSKA